MCPYDAEDEDKETHDIDPFPPLLYVDDCVRPIFASDGVDDILCKFCRRHLRRLSFAGVSKGMGSENDMVGSMASVIVSGMSCAIPNEVVRKTVDRAEFEVKRL